MSTQQTKSAAVYCLLKSIADRYGPNVFPLDDQQPNSAERVVLTSARDKCFSASIIALRERPANFSVMVELYDPPEPRLFPFEIAENGEFSLTEVVKLLGRYQDWVRADTCAGGTPCKPL